MESYIADPNSAPLESRDTEKEVENSLNTTLFEDFLSSRFQAHSDFSKNLPEQRNGLASEKLLEIERWADDQKNCGHSLNSDQMAEKLSKFAKEADDTWEKMEKSGDMQKFLDMSGDTYLTYNRFGDLLMQLDDARREKVLETLPWRLRPGE